MTLFTIYFFFTLLWCRQVDARITSIQQRWRACDLEFCLALYGTCMFFFLILFPHCDLLIFCFQSCSYPCLCSFFCNTLIYCLVPNSTIQFFLNTTVTPDGNEGLDLIWPHCAMVHAWLRHSSGSGLLQSSSAVYTQCAVTGTVFKPVRNHILEVVYLSRLRNQFTWNCFSLEHFKCYV